MGWYKFLACLEPIRSYAWSNGHSDPDLGSVMSIAVMIRKLFIYLTFFLEFNFDFNQGEIAAPNFINNTNNAVCTLYDGQKLTAERDQYLCQLISKL